MKRRTFLKSVIALNVIGIYCVHSLKALGSPDLFICFMMISNYLTAEEILDEKKGSEYFRVLIVDTNNASKITELYSYVKDGLAIPDDREDLKALSKKILVYWYTGIIQEGGQQKVIDYFGALSWKKLAFTKPQGVCG
ncbi:MAG: hypothetical protein RIQ94_2194 [Pseudomonadota bacterium]|jgi:hypothetical protein